MRKILWLGLALMAGLAVARSEVNFSETLTPEEYAAAGLDQLTPAQRAKLDELVKEHRTKAVKTAVKATEVEVTQKMEKKMVEKQEEQKMAAGEATEHPIEPSTINPPFKGWKKGTILTLANGQRWLVIDEGSYWSPVVNKPLKVTLKAGLFGAYFMWIEDGGHPKVKYLGKVGEAGE